jgi:DNA polymerase-3 subunit delta
VKVQTGSADGFCRRPDPAIGVVLLYGPDQGLVADRRRQLVEAVLGAADDPFRLTELEAERVTAAPGLLLEEAQALSLVGGRRIVLLRQATDTMAKPLAGLLGQGGHAALVIVEAGELGAGSALRRLAEKDRAAAAIACYRIDGAGLASQIRDHLRGLGLSAEPEAMAYLVEHLGGNRELTRAELEKLALYKGEDRAARITLDDVAAVVGNSSALYVDALVWACLVGRPGTAEPILDRLLGEGQAAVRLIRAISSALLRLLPLAARAARGEAPAAVVQGARPPVHFSQRASMQRALESWRAAGLEAALALALEAERRCKRARAPERLLLRRLVHEIALLPR